MSSVKSQFADSAERGVDVLPVPVYSHADGAHVLDVEARVEVLPVAPHVLNLAVVVFQAL